MKILKNEWDVMPVNKDRAKEFVEEHHYAHGAGDLVTACYGLFFKGDPHTLHGVAMWNPPAYGAAIKANDDFANVLSLTRFCLVDERPENAGSFLISKSIKELDRRWHTLLTYADTALNHNGGLYRAANWNWDGLTRANPRYWDPENECLVSRKKGKNSYNRTQMQEMGYEFLGNFKMHKYLYPRFKGRKNVVIIPKSKQPDFIQGSLNFTKDGKILGDDT